MKYVVTVNDKNYEVDVEKGEARIVSVGAAAPVAAPVAAVAPVAVAAAPAAVAPAAAPVVKAGQAGGEPLTAPMPGTIVSIQKKPGDHVKSGDIVLIMEAMKMENEIVAHRDGTISEILCSKGASVTTGEPLVLIV
jgi:glutaconyl-CoA/methylmalonyl-CoA decarboxylase subunit gamma